MPRSVRLTTGLTRSSLLVVAALTVTIRLPFLLHADRFFDSDEAVEGLMARHVLQGELPVFLWGQRYKGVPEVYLNAAVFSVAGSSVVALKAVTLACFAIVVCLQFLLVERMFSRAIAWIATAFLIVGPPSLVLWSLSANAEVVHHVARGHRHGPGRSTSGERSGSRLALGVAAGAVGFGLWVHQYILYYWSRSWRTRSGPPLPRERGCASSSTAEGCLRGCESQPQRSARSRPAMSRLGLMAFVTSGFDVTIGGLFVGLNHPQKLWHIAAALLIVSGAARFAGQLVQPNHRDERPLALAAVLGFLIGYAPVLAANHGSLSLPLARMDARDLVHAAGTIATVIVPMTLGFRSPSTEWLPVSPWFGLILAALVMVSFFALRRRAVSPFFHILLVVVPICSLQAGAITTRSRIDT